MQRDLVGLSTVNKIQTDRQINLPVGSTDLNSKLQTQAGSQMMPNDSEQKETVMDAKFDA